MIDIINDATDEIIMAESEDSKLMEELHKNKSDLIDDFDVEVNENEKSDPVISSIVSCMLSMFSDCVISGILLTSLFSLTWSTES
jgi:hypothetical protein